MASDQREASAFWRLCSRQLGEQYANLRRRQYVIHRRVLKDTARHVGDGCLVRILNDSQTSASSNRQDSRRTTIELPGHHYADHPRAKLARRRPEQHVDRRPVSILSGTAHHPKVLALQREVVVARGDVDVALLD